RRRALRRIDSIAAIALPPPQEKGTRRRLIAGSCTVAAHGGLVLALLAMPVQDPAAMQHARRLHVVEVFEAPPPPAPEPEVAPEPEPAPPPPPRPVAAAPRPVP